jgi:integrase
MLPKKAKVASVVPYAALPYRQIATFMSELRQHDDAGVRALELLILRASRSGEVLKVKWSEFDLDNRLWTIPAERMKARKEHRVPISAAALAVLEKQKAIKTNEFVFAAGRGTEHASIHTLERVLKRVDHHNVTVHGFRSTFTDWCAEQTATPSEVREMALAHKVGNAVEAAYRRGDLFQKRRALAEAWARYCDDAEVVSFPVEARSA